MSNNQCNPYQISWRLIYGFIFVSSENIHFRASLCKIHTYDNHTNFVVANNKLNLPIKEIDQTKLHKFSNHQNIECIFNTPASQIMDGRSMRILSQISQNHVKSNWKTLHIYGWRSPNISLQSAISFKWTSLNLYQRLYIWLRVINSKPFAHWRTITKSESWKLHK